MPELLAIRRQFQRHHRPLEPARCDVRGLLRAPFSNLDAYGKRMGWSFKWVSSAANDFNRDYHVSFTPEDLANGEAYYNYTKQKLWGSDMPGASVFYKDPSGELFHTYSTYGRGLDMLMLNYHYLDLVPKGRNEADLSYPQAWVRHHDKYDD